MTSEQSTPQLGRLRINLLRLAYAPLALGLAVVQLPLLAEVGPDWDVMESAVTAMLSALCLLSFVGLFRPLTMLPLLLFETLWKILWLALVGIPAWFAGPLDPSIAATMFACAFVIPIVILVPWDFVIRKYWRSDSELA